MANVHGLQAGVLSIYNPVATNTEDVPCPLHVKEEIYLLEQQK
jgi:hypothetical protein